MFANCKCAGTIVLGILGLGGLALPGCASADPHVRVGEALSGTGGLQPADYAPDFPFIDGNGQPNRFSQVRGEVTVVMFPNQPGEWVNPDEIRQLAALTNKLSVGEVPVTIIDVGRPQRTAEQAEPLVDRIPLPPSRLVMVADPDGRIRALFGPHARGRFFVIDNFNQIVSVGRFTGVDSLRGPVRQEVHTVADEVPEEHG